MVIGTYFKTKIINFSDKLIKLKLWDIEGKESSRTMKRYYYRGANCILFIYDVTNADSFKKIENLNKEVLTENNDALRILIGNKIDKSNRVITEEEGRRFAN